jgi:essential nuclear protein 1
MVKGISQKSSNFKGKGNNNKGVNNPKNNVSQKHLQNKRRNTNSSATSINSKRSKFNSRFSNNKNFNFSKNQKKQKFLDKKSSQNKSLKKQEEEIVNLENERDLFDDQGFYKSSAENDNNLEINENEWNNVNESDWNNLQSGKTINLSDMLFKQMTNVEQKKFDPRIIEAYSIVANILSSYVSGKLPKAFNILPSTENWEELIELTKPDNWSPQATLEATTMFSSNFGSELAEKFYAKILLPAVRNNIRVHKKLNIHLYNCLKKAIFKPSAFFKGIILPMSENLSAKEAAVIGSILKKCSIPVTHSSACIMKLMSLKPGMGVLFFMKILLLKKYAIPTKVKEALVAYFCKFAQEEKGNPFNNEALLPVLWHQTLLVFVQFYKNDLTEEEKDKIRSLVSVRNHHLISEDIYRELNYKAPTLGNLKSLNASQMQVNSMNVD